MHTLNSKGVSIRAADLAFLGPYATSKLKRFGEYPTDQLVAGFGEAKRSEARFGARGM